MTTERYDLYASKLSSLDELRLAVERVLAISFEPHEGGYMGGDYFLFYGPSNEKIRIQHNRYTDYVEWEVAELDFADYPTLLRVDGTMRGDELKERLMSRSARSPTSSA